MKSWGWRNGGARAYKDNFDPPETITLVNSVESCLGKETKQKKKRILPYQIFIDCEWWIRNSGSDSQRGSASIFNYFFPQFSISAQERTDRHRNEIKHLLFFFLMQNSSVFTVYGIPLCYANDSGGKPYLHSTLERNHKLPQNTLN